MPCTHTYGPSIGRRLLLLAPAFAAAPHVTLSASFAQLDSQPGFTGTGAGLDPVEYPSAAEAEEDVDERRPLARTRRQATGGVTQGLRQLVDESQTAASYGATFGIVSIVMLAATALVGVEIADSTLHCVLCMDPAIESVVDHYPYKLSVLTCALADDPAPPPKPFVSPAVAAANAAAAAASQYAPPLQQHHVHGLTRIPVRPTLYLAVTCAP